VPAKSKAQQAFMAVQLDKKRRGKKTDVDMSAEQLEEFASTPTKKLPEKAKPARKRSSKASY
jgi:hypothetical protein